MLANDADLEVLDTCVRKFLLSWHNDTVFNMCNDSKEHEEVCLVD